MVNFISWATEADSFARAASLTTSSGVGIESHRTGQCLAASQMLEIGDGGAHLDFQELGDRQHQRRAEGRAGLLARLQRNREAQA